MDDSLILFTGMFCFAMTMLGAGMTVFAFRHKASSNGEAVASAKSG